MIVPETAKVLASYDHPLRKIRRHHPQSVRKGTLTYEGTLLSDELQQKVLLQVLELAGLAGPDENCLHLSGSSMEPATPAPGCTSI